MARGNIFLGKARGRVGSVVFSKGKSGQQVTRAYQSQVANPRTMEQMVQRGIFASVSTAGGILSDIVNHSFDGIKEGIDNRNEFVRVNTRKMAAFVRANGAAAINPNIKPKGASYIQPYEFQLSRGSLGDYFYGSRILKTGLSSTGATIGDLMALFPGLAPGCQLTFIALYEDYSTQPQRSYRVKKCRLVFNELAFGDVNTVVLVNNNFISTYFDVPSCDGFRFQEEDAYLEGSIFGLIGTGDNKADAVFYDPEESAQITGVNGALVGWAVILSVYNSTKADPWQHTTSTMAIDYDAWDDTNDNIATYGTTSEEKTSELYLDQAMPELRGRFVEHKLSELVSGIVAADDREPQILSISQTNDYGPIAEGTMVTIKVSVPLFYIIRGSSVLSGGAELPAGWSFSLAPGSRVLTASGPMTATNLPIKVSIRVVNVATNTVVGDPAINITLRSGS